MYIPKHFDMPDRDEQVAFMRANSFAALVSHVDGGIFATHAPVRTHLEDGRVWLGFHLAMANAQVAALQQDGAALIIFQGPHAYISPSNYEKRENVPTWNYVAVHAYGMARVIDDLAAKHAMMADLIGHYEAAFQLQWDEQSDKYRDGMLAGIVAFEVDVTRLEGKAKLSQNRSPEDQARVADWLQGHAHGAPRAVGQLMKKRLSSNG
jgi:transcriptional regulator